MRDLQTYYQVDSIIIISTVNLYFMSVTLIMVRLGAPRWKDPERRQSIDHKICVKMEARYMPMFRTSTCWPAKIPARDCLIDSMKQLEDLLEIRSRDFWDRETTSPGCIWDASMHGRSVDDAQPTIILSSTSKIFRHNAREIIEDHDFRVDPRGIGIEYYSRGPEFFAGDSPAINNPGTYLAGFEGIDGEETTIAPNDSRVLEIPESIGVPILVGSTKCTMGGLIVIDKKLFGLTVAHAFENGNTSSRGELSLQSLRPYFDAFY
jgi:hypothetical protein